jgi:molecular chaperone DnaK
MTLPVSASKIYLTYRDDQTKIHVTAYKGESPDPYENYLLNCFELSGIPKARAGKEKKNIRFEYDLNGILTIQAEIVSTGKSATVTVNISQMGKNLDLSKWKDVPAARKYRQIINKAEWFVKVHGDEASGDVKVAADELKKRLL